jgi:uncharacterized protein YjbI with pentapeptide repeats
MNHTSFSESFGVNVSFIETIIESCDFTNTSIINSDFSNAIVKNTDFSDSTITYEHQLVYARILVNVRLANGTIINKM